ESCGNFTTVCNVDRRTSGWLNWNRRYLCVSVQRTFWVPVTGQLRARHRGGRDLLRMGDASATQPVATKGGGPTMKSTLSVLAVVLLLAITYACSTTKPKGVETDPAVRAQRAPVKSFDDRVDDNAKEMLKEGKKIFRYDTFGSEEFWGRKLFDTFGSEEFWGRKLRLHEAILGEKLGGVGPGVTARQALQLGLKAD